MTSLGRSFALPTAIVAASVGQCGTRVIDAVDLPATPTPDFIWYVLDETQGTTATDSSPHHYDITNLTGVSWANGANFDGIKGGGWTTVDRSYRAPPITISAWLTPQARSDSTLNQYGLLPYPPNAIGDDKPGFFGYGIGLNVWTDGTGGSAIAAEDVDVCQNIGTLPHACVAYPSAGNAGPFLAGHEYFVVAAIGTPKDTASPISARVYVNGALLDETTASNPGDVTQTTLYLGCHNADPLYGSKRVFSGRIRDARVYKRELGAAEVAQLFANGPTTMAPRSAKGRGGDASPD